MEFVYSIVKSLYNTKKSEGDFDSAIHLWTSNIIKQK